MTKTKLIVRVKFKSRLPREKVEKVIEARIEDFRALQGLQQKFYLLNEETGEYGGLYLWESEQAFTDYRQSRLRASIGEAYQTEGPPDVEVFQVIRELRE